MSAELDQRMIEGDMVSQVLREPDHGKDFGFESEEDGKSSGLFLFLLLHIESAMGHKGESQHPEQP